MGNCHAQERFSPAPNQLGGLCVCSCKRKVSEEPHRIRPTPSHVHSAQLHLLLLCWLCGLHSECAGQRVQMAVGSGGPLVGSCCELCVSQRGPEPSPEFSEKSPVDFRMSRVRPRVSKGSLLPLHTAYVSARSLRSDLDASLAISFYLYQVNVLLREEANW